MLTDAMLTKLETPMENTPNVVALDLPAWEDKGKTLAVADPRLRGMAQRIINEIAEHRHLREARVLLVVEFSDSAGEKLESGERVQIGKAARANPLARLLTSLTVVDAAEELGRQVAAESLDDGLAPDGHGDEDDDLDADEVDDDGVVIDDPPTPAAALEDRHADFVVKLNGNWLELVANRKARERGEPIILTGLDQIPDACIPVSWLALIDHELLHCGAKIAGEFVARDQLEAKRVQLGEDLVEVCEDVTREREDSGLEVLVRSYHRDKGGNYQWKMRKHDVEEFDGIARRHGCWDAQLRRLADVMLEDGREVEPGQKPAAETQRRRGKREKKTA